MTPPKILGVPKSAVLASIGIALLQVKNARGLKLDDMAEVLGRTDDMCAHYIAGESEMGVVAFLRAVEAWPEFEDRLAETAADRAAKARQRALDLNLTSQRHAA